jgi:hypothetical protein
MRNAALVVPILERDGAARFLCITAFIGFQGTGVASAL